MILNYEKRLKGTDLIFKKHTVIKVANNSGYFLFINDIFRGDGGSVFIRGYWVTRICDIYAGYNRNPNFGWESMIRHICEIHSFSTYEVIDIDPSDKESMDTVDWSTAKVYRRTSDS